MCGTRMYPYGRSLEIPRGRGGGVLKAKLLKEMYEAIMEFPGGEGGAKQKSFCRGEWIFSGTRQFTCTWLQFFSTEWIKSFLVEYFPRESNGIPQLYSIFFCGQVVWVDNGMLIWIPRLQLDISTTCSPHGTNMYLEGNNKL